MIDRVPESTFGLGESLILTRLQPGGDAFEVSEVTVSAVFARRLELNR
jgi:hypothetical protein